MPQQYEEYLQGYEVPPDSRAKVNLYGGSVCPVDLSFGYIHGESPNRGEMKYKEDATPPIGKTLLVQCGYHTYYGLIVRAVIDNDVSTGNKRSISFVDMRDRLHDVIHYAQWNMTDDDKFRIYHIFPWDWKKQKRSYINQKERDIIIQKKDQDTKKIKKELYETQEQVSPLSAKSILNYLGETFNFTITATEKANKRLESYYPDNLDFNGGVKVISCISAIIESLNLQFCCYGDLNVHVTMKGVADNEFDKKLLAGTVELCKLPGYKSATLGSELNERGRRVNIVGGRNRHEHWYPLYPSWNMKWDGKLVLNQSLLSALLVKNNIAYVQKLDAMPVDYAGANIIYNGVGCHTMSIREYYENIPFKVFDADFSTEVYNFGGVFFTKKAEEDQEDDNYKNLNNYNFFTHQANGLELKDGIRDRRGAVDNGATFFGLDKGKFYRPIDSSYPISSMTVSSFKDQFKIFGTNRSFENKGADVNRNALKGTREQLKDIASMDVNEVLEYSDDENFVEGRFKARFVFNQQMFKIKIPEAEEEGEIEFLPDELFVCLSTDREVFTYDIGDSYTSPRVRTIVKNVSDLRRSFFEDGSEEKADTYDIRNMFIVDSDKNAGKLTITDIAKAIADNTLLHEFVTSSGNIVFRKSCGFLPTGIIESVNVTFDSKSGIQETTNFTNAVNNEQTPVYRTDTSTKFNAKEKYVTGTSGNGKRADDPLVKDALRDMKNAGAGGPGGGNQAISLKPPEGTPQAHFNGNHQAHAFGGLRNAALAEIEMDTLDDEKMRQGELIILNEPPA